MTDLIERTVERLQTEREELWRNLIEAGFDIEGVVSAVIDALDIPIEVNMPIDLWPYL